MMGFAFGGLAVLSVPRHVGAWSSLIEIRSMFLALVFSLVIIVLAYITNPSETSFRAFLTEQSFRHHLTKLDDAQDDHQIDHRRHGLLDASLAKHGSLDSSPFQFADRASVSLRTPKHFFRSFGVLSVAAVLPSGAGGGHARLDGTNPSLINNSWFIGAFGLWWWAAPLDGFWRDIGIVGLKEEDGSSITGILDMKALDRVHDRHVLPSTHQLQSPNNGKQRSRERLNHQRQSSGNVVTNRRSSTPPPLPRSVSLPLHAKRTGMPPTNPSSAEHTSRSHGTHSATPLRQRQSQQPHPHMPTASGNEQSSTATANGTLSQPTSNNSSSPSSSPSSKSPAVAFAESPQVADLQRKVDTAQESVNELQEQLTSATQSASANAATRQLQEELEQQRARKQADDATRTEIRTRTRALEDSKRHAESSKREVEKRLKSAQNAAATSERRTSTLTAETTSLRAAAQGHVERAEQSKIEADALCTEMKEEVEGRKSEVKDVEDVLTALVRRVKELEAKVAEEEERLRRACEEAEIRKQSEPLEESLDTSSRADTLLWPIKSPRDAKPRVMPVGPALEHGVNGHGSLSRFDDAVERTPVGYYSRSMLPKRGETAPATSFAPFRTDQREDNPISPLSSSFIPSSLIESLGIHSTAPALYSPSSIAPHSPLSSDQHEQCLSPMSRSFQSEDDVILDRRDSAPFNNFGLAPGSGAPSAFVPTPASLSPASPNRSIAEERSEENGIIGSGTLLDTGSVTQQQGNHSSKRSGWFARDRKGHSASVGGGLNPDAKEFSLPKDRTRTLSFLLSKPRSATVTSGTSDGLVNGTSPSFDSKANTPDSSGSSSSFTPSFEDSVSSLSSFSSPAASIRSTASSGLPNATSSNKFLGLSGVSGLGSAWLGNTHSAFAPTPIEREALTRAFVGGSSSKNASTDQLPIFLTSASTSPQPLPAIPSASAVVNNKTHRSPGPISRPTWLESLRNGKAGTSKSSSFSPFDDESSSA